MQIQTTTAAPQDFDGEAVVLGVWSDTSLPESTAAVDRACGGVISRMVELKEIATGRCDVTPLLGLASVSAPLVLVVGLGSQKDQKPGLAKQVAGTAAKVLAKRARQSVGFFLNLEPMDQAIAGAMVGCVGQDLFRAEPKLFAFESMVWGGASQDEVDAGTALGESINTARRLINLPASDIYPESFAEECVRLGQACGFEVEVWDEVRLAEERCGAHLAVGQGSTKPPRTVIMRHLKGDPARAPLGLVGKGVTFDSGGLSLKPSASMLDMKCDMSGAAAGVGAMMAISRLDLPVNVIGFVGLAENMVSGDSYKLGDVLTARNGKTIEVHNTDAEGRLVLADTLDVAVSTGVGQIVDLATLTGACMIALGQDVAGLMANNQTLCDQVSTAAISVAEPAWQLPMFAEYGDHIKSDVADIKNVGDGRWAGAITAAKLLEEFVAETPWVHIDIAGPSFLAKPKAWIDAGGSGCFVHTLVELARCQSAGGE